MQLSFSYTPYIAIIGDIIKSKELGDRKSVQEKLSEILIDVNGKYRNDISSKFMITLGDEFQGLLHTGEKIMDIIEYVQRKMYPVEIRFGIGVGRITTAINPEMAIGADGPGYYNARRAIEILKSDELKNKKQTSDIRIEIEGNYNQEAEMLNTIFSLMSVIKKGWSIRQREIIGEYERLGSSQKECAQRLGITQSSVHRSLINGNYYVYRSAVNLVNDVLKEIDKKDGNK